MKSNKHKPIYLDNAATTIIDDRVAKSVYDKMVGDDFGNPSSNTHIYGWKAQKSLIDARQRVANILNCKSREVIFTSGATESNNIAIQSTLNYFLRNFPNVHAITSMIEHKAVLDTFRHMESLGVRVSYLVPDSNGVISKEALSKAICKDTKLVSLMHVNNELGSINDINQLGIVCASANILFHVDAAQSLGKLPIDVKADSIDLLSISGHKIYAPKGIGALYFSIKARNILSGLMFGGNQERSVRPGTQSMPLIEGLATAIDIAISEMSTNFECTSWLKHSFIKKLLSLDVPVLINTENSVTSPYIVSIHIPNVENDEMLMGLNGVAVSTGSACNSEAQSHSHVLASTVPSRLSSGSNIRVSFSPKQLESEIIAAASCIASHYHKIIKRHSSDS